MNERAPAEALTPKIYSRRLVAEALLHGAPASRARLARETGLSKQTISLVIADLEAEGWVRPIGVSKGAVGRRAVSYDLATRRGALYRRRSRRLQGLRRARRSRRPNPGRGDRNHGPARRRQRLPPGSRDCARAGRGARGRSRRARAASSSACPASSIPRPARSALAPNIRGLSELSAPRTLAELFGSPVIVENDVNLAMLGEAWRGCARGAAKRRVSRARHRRRARPDRQRPACARRDRRGGRDRLSPIGDDLDSDAAREIGAFELEVGGAGILRRYNKAAAAVEHTVREVFDRLNAGERAAVEAIDATARSVALAATALAALLDPEMIVLGGSVGVRPELVERVRAAMPALLCAARGHPRQRARRPRGSRRRRVARGQPAAQYAVRHFGRARRFEPAATACREGRRMSPDPGRIAALRAALDEGARARSAQARHRHAERNRRRARFRRALGAAN